MGGREENQKVFSLRKGAGAGKCSGQSNPDSVTITILYLTLKGVNVRKSKSLEVSKGAGLERAEKDTIKQCCH